jgi:hypothetical protein
MRLSRVRRYAADNENWFILPRRRPGAVVESGNRRALPPSGGQQNCPFYATLDPAAVNLAQLGAGHVCVQNARPNTRTAPENTDPRRSSRRPGNRSAFRVCGRFPSRRGAPSLRLHVLPGFKPMLGDAFSTRFHAPGECDSRGGVAPIPRRPSSLPPIAGALSTQFRRKDSVSCRSRATAR